MVSAVRLPVRDDTLAEFARSKFAKHGRGAVVVMEGGVVWTKEGEKFGTALAYFHEGTELFHQAGGHWPGKTKLAVETYDPEREIVVITIDMGNKIEAFLISMPDLDEH
ncbi:MAG: hypothetical protein IT175_02090 [Acidobacteria bacterium]|nr:hypothetical protein [Acidobacteriota bacterium]